MAVVAVMMMVVVTYLGHVRGQRLALSGKVVAAHVVRHGAVGHNHARRRVHGHAHGHGHGRRRRGQRVVRAHRAGHPALLLLLLYVHLPSLLHDQLLLLLLPQNLRREPSTG
jgi:hypothetical protein